MFARYRWLKRRRASPRMCSSGPENASVCLAAPAASRRAGRGRSYRSTSHAPRCRLGQATCARISSMNLGSGRGQAVPTSHDRRSARQRAACTTADQHGAPKRTSAEVPHTSARARRLPAAVRDDHCVHEVGPGARRKLPSQPAGGGGGGAGSGITMPKGRVIPGGGVGTGSGAGAGSGSGAGGVAVAGSGLPGTASCSGAPGAVCCSGALDSGPVAASEPGCAQSAAPASPSADCPAASGFACAAGLFGSWPGSWPGAAPKGCPGASGVRPMPA